MSNQTTHLGFTDFRNERKKFGIMPKDRLRHMYVIGKTGTGKSTFLEQIALQDILNGEGFTFLDPHGKTADLLLEYIPESRKKDVVYFAPFDTDHPISFNVMEDVEPDRRSLVANGLLSTFKKIYPDAFSGRMEYIFSNTILALLETPDSTLLGINRMYSDKEFRKGVVDNIKDPSVKSFWADEFANWEPKFQKEATASIVNKVGQFTANPIIRNMMGQPKSSFDIRDLMDQGKIIIANLSKGRLGDENSRLIGGMLVSKLYLAAMSRAQMTEDEIDNLPSHYLYADEFQNFANDSFAQILAEARKYKLGLIVAHQYVSQMPETVRDAIFGNVGTMVIFRIGEMDAEPFAREFSPTFVEEDFTNLAFGQYYMKLSINGVSSRPFSAAALGPLPSAAGSIAPEIIKTSQVQFAVPRAQVEAAIATWFEPIPDKKAIEYQAYLEQKKQEILAKGGTWMDGDEYKVRKEIGALPETHQKSDRSSYQKREDGGYQKPSYQNRDTGNGSYDRKPAGVYQKPYEKQSVKPPYQTSQVSTPHQSNQNRPESSVSDYKKAPPVQTETKPPSLKELFSAIKLPEIKNQDSDIVEKVSQEESVVRSSGDVKPLIDTASVDSRPQFVQVQSKMVGENSIKTDNQKDEIDIRASEARQTNSSPVDTLPVTEKSILAEKNTGNIKQNSETKKESAPEIKSGDSRDTRESEKFQNQKLHKNNRVNNNDRSAVKPFRSEGVKDSSTHISNNTDSKPIDTPSKSLRDLLAGIKQDVSKDIVENIPDTLVVRKSTPDNHMRDTNRNSSDASINVATLKNTESKPVNEEGDFVKQEIQTSPMIQTKDVAVQVSSENEHAGPSQYQSAPKVPDFDVEEYLRTLSVPIKTDPNVKREIPEDVLRNLFSEN